MRDHHPPPEESAALDAPIRRSPPPGALIRRAPASGGAKPGSGSAPCVSSRSCSARRHTSFRGTWASRSNSFLWARDRHAENRSTPFRGNRNEPSWGRWGVHASQACAGGVPAGRKNVTTYTHTGPHGRRQTPESAARAQPIQIRVRAREYTYLFRQTAKRRRPPSSPRVCRAGPEKEFPPFFLSARRWNSFPSHAHAWGKTVWVLVHHFSGSTRYMKIHFCLTLLMYPCAAATASMPRG